MDEPSSSVIEQNQQIQLLVLKFWPWFCRLRKITVMWFG